MRARWMLPAAMLALTIGCGGDDAVQPEPVEPAAVFGAAEPCPVEGYAGDVMEPFLARDGELLLFNDMQSNTDLHFARRTTGRDFVYGGRIAGVNSKSLEGVPSLDGAGRLYFVSTRSYELTLATIYSADFADGAGRDVVLLEQLSRHRPGWANFDVEAFADRSALILVEGRFDKQGGPYEADFVLARRQEDEFVRAGGEVFAAVNTAALEYGPAISADGLELYFNRIELPVTAQTKVQLLRSVRAAPDEPFGPASRIVELEGVAESPALSPDGGVLYFHRRTAQGYRLFACPRLDRGR